MVVQLVPMRDRRIDTEVGGYRLVEPIGEGGTSVVYRAEHVRLGRAAALKLLTPTLGEADFRERFLRESRLAASLDHPSIVPVYDAGEADDVLYIAMQHIDGSDLKALLVAEGRLPVRRALRIVSQIASALDAAHARGLVHRDVKPANILVGANDRAFLSDFGVVKELSSSGRTRTGGFVGTIDYCAPEQIEGRDVDAARRRLRTRVRVLRVHRRHVAVPPVVRRRNPERAPARTAAALLEGGARPAACARAGAREGAREVAARPLRDAAVSSSPHSARRWRSRVCIRAGSSSRSPCSPVPPWRAPRSRPRSCSGCGTTRRRA